MRILSGVIAAAMIASPALAGHRAKPVTVTGFGNCPHTNGICAELSPGSAVTVLQGLPVQASTAGTVLLSTTGTGVCYNKGSDVEVADFTTGLSSNPNATPDYELPGSNRFEFTLPAAANGLTGNGVFNLASQVLYDVSKGSHTFYMTAAPNRIDSRVLCDVVSLSITAVFIPG